MRTEGYKAKMKNKTRFNRGQTGAANGTVLAIAHDRVGESTAVAVVSKDKDHGKGKWMMMMRKRE